MPKINTHLRIFEPPCTIQTLSLTTGIVTRMMYDELQASLSKQSCWAHIAMARQWNHYNEYIDTGANFRRAARTGRPPPKNTEERKGEGRQRQANRAKNSSYSKLAGMQNNYGERAPDA